MAHRGLGLIAWFAASVAQAAIVTNPVPAPITPGVTVGLTLFGQAQASGDLAIDGFRTRIQQLQPVRDGSGRLFVNDTNGTISMVGVSG